MCWVFRDRMNSTLQKILTRVPIYSQIKARKGKGARSFSNEAKAYQYGMSYGPC